MRLDLRDVNAGGDVLLNPVASASAPATFARQIPITPNGEPRLVTIAYGAYPPDNNRGDAGLLLPTFEFEFSSNSRGTQRVRVDGLRPSRLTLPCSSLVVKGSFQNAVAGVDNYTFRWTVGEGAQGSLNFETPTRTRRFQMAAGPGARSAPITPEPFASFLDHMYWDSNETKINGALYRVYWYTTPTIVAAANIQINSFSDQYAHIPRIAQMYILENNSAVATTAWIAEGIVL